MRRNPVSSRKSWFLRGVRAVSDRFRLPPERDKMGRPTPRRRCPMYRHSLIAALLFCVTPLAAQTVKTKWTPPRTPDGQPDLQGVWTNPTVTPFERPTQFANKAVLTKEEAAQV